MRAPKALIHVQHLLGVGHLRRAATLARGLCRSGFGVTLVSGGFPDPDLDLGGAALVQLPPTRAADDHFTTLLDDRDRPVDEAWKARRKARLLAAFERVRPDVLVFELFPFGRRQLRFEIDPLIERAQATAPRPLMVSSVRDILVPRKPERVAEIVGRVRDRFDLVLVHGDPTLIPFEATFPAADRVADRLRYTGYLLEPGPARPDGGVGSGEVLVSAGGGAVGERILETALAARALTGLAAAPWRVLVGHGLPEARFRALGASAPSGVVVERARPDFPRLLANCRLSISQGGYNTIVQVLRAGVPCVAVPFAGGNETEQAFRCRRLAERGLLRMVEESRLAPTTLAAAVDAALEDGRSGAAGIAIDNGAARSAALIRAALDARAASPPACATGAAAPAGKMR
jgi:predicted glycosyltransferase